MVNFVNNYCEFPAAVRRPMWRIWHELLIFFDRNQTTTFMNYGYSNLNGNSPIKLSNEDEKNRFCIQLYDQVVNSVVLKDKKVIEIGSGRGGGTDYIARYYKPQKIIGVDISGSVINFCNRHYNAPGLTFVKGRAKKIPIESMAYDVVINVESARCYSNIKAFFMEVYRILKPDGHFLITDMIEKGNVTDMINTLETCGFTIIKKEEITKNVAKGLELDTKRREMLIQKNIPKALRNLFKEFAGTKGTKRFESLNNCKFEYWSFVLVKNPS